jgi:hypothetical protein
MGGLSYTVGMEETRNDAILWARILSENTIRINVCRRVILKLPLTYVIEMLQFWPPRITESRDKLQAQSRPRGSQIYLIMYGLFNDVTASVV